MKFLIPSAALLAGVVSLSSAALAQTFPTTDGGLTTTDPDHWNFCGGETIAAGPQSPRDIDRVRGANPTRFAPALGSNRMNLCNIHFHWNAEHKSAAFSTFVDTGDERSGWAVVAPASVDPAYRAAHDVSHLLDDDHAHETGVIVGDTIEVHWVHTSCTVDYAELDPANGLANCTTQFCANPQLRVVAQIFKVVADDADVDRLDRPMRSRGPRVVYAGSTTGPGYHNDHCSPLQVTWDVKRSVATIDAQAVAEWAHSTGEHAHGVRELVTRRALLSRARVKRGRW